jgi:recombination protein RecA
MEEEKKKALEVFKASMNKKYGSGTIQVLGGQEVVAIKRITSGIMSLDWAMGGGFPVGRITTMAGVPSSGKSSVALHTIAEAQSRGLICAYIDAESSFDPVYAQNLGVNVSDLIFNQPNCAEEALDIVDEICSTGLAGLVIIDSVAALTPKAEMEGEMADQQMGLQARLMSKFCRKVTANVSKNNVCLIMLNQLRSKVGFFMGCLHADTKINFVDGRSLPIKQVVKNRTEGSVWSYNEKTKSIEPKKIIDWHFNGLVEKQEDFINIQCLSIGGFGRYSLAVTPNHKVLTKNGWKEAKDIINNDYLISKYNSKINGSVKEFLTGIFVGDSTIKQLQNKREGGCASLTFQDNKNPEYVQWKISKLKDVFNFKEKNYIAHNKNLKKYVTEHNPELSLIKQELKERDPLFFFKEGFSWLSLALWFMDDAHLDASASHLRYILSVKRCASDTNTLNLLCNNFKNNNLDCSFNQKDGSITFTKEATFNIAKNIATFIPKCMQYKLPELHQGKYKEFTLNFSPEIKCIDTPVVSTRFSSKKQIREKGKYDISVSENHNYMVGGFENGVIVHNSPEVMPAGEALKFYSSIILDVRKRGQIKSGDEIVANESEIKVSKNKTAPPYRTASFEIEFGQGVNKMLDLVRHAAEQKVITTKGAWFSFKGTMIGQGEKKVVAYLQDHPVTVQEIKEGLKQATIFTVVPPIVVDNEEPDSLFEA